MGKVLCQNNDGRKEQKINEFEMRWEEGCSLRRRGSKSQTETTEESGCDGKTRAKGDLKVLVRNGVMVVFTEMKNGAGRRILEGKMRV